MWPEFELVRDFMAVLVTCKFDDDPIKNEDVIVSTNIFFIISLWGQILALKGKYLQSE